MANDDIRPPGAISAEAAAMIEAAVNQPERDLTSLPISALREETRAAYAPECEAEVARLGVTVSDTIIAGTPCMIIDPPEPVSGRHLLYLFGGGFTLGSPFEDLPISAALSVATGARVIAPEYPLAPEHPYPAALDACTAVARWVLNEFADTCLAGESAGGNLAIGVTQRLRAGGDRLPRALALLSPAADLSDLGDSSAADRDPFLKAANTEFFSKAYIPDGTPRSDPGVSPIYGSFDATFPPCFITTGTRDLLLSACVRLDHVLRDAGVQSQLRVWEGMWHVFEFYPGLPEARASLDEIGGFLERHHAPS